MLVTAGKGAAYPHAGAGAVVVAGVMGRNSPTYSSWLVGDSS